METSDLIKDEYLKGILKIIEGLNLILKTNNSKATVYLGTIEEQKEILENLLNTFKERQ